MDASVANKGRQRRLLRPIPVTQRHSPPRRYAPEAYRREYLRFREPPREPNEGWLPVLLILGLAFLAGILVINMGLVIVRGVEAPFREFQRLGDSLGYR